MILFVYGRPADVDDSIYSALYITRDNIISLPKLQKQDLQELSKACFCNFIFTEEGEIKLRNRNQCRMFNPPLPAGSLEFDSGKPKYLSAFGLLNVLKELNVRVFYKPLEDLYPLKENEFCMSNFINFGDMYISPTADYIYLTHTIEAAKGCVSQRKKFPFVNMLAPHTMIVLTSDLPSDMYNDLLEYGVLNPIDSKKLPNDFTEKVCMLNFGLLPYISETSIKNSFNMSRAITGATMFSLFEMCLTIHHLISGYNIARNENAILKAMEKEETDLTEDNNWDIHIHSIQIPGSKYASIMQFDYPFYPYSEDPISVQKFLDLMDNSNPAHKILAIGMTELYPQYRDDIFDSELTTQGQNPLYNKFEDLCFIYAKIKSICTHFALTFSPWRLNYTSYILGLASYRGVFGYIKLKCDWRQVTSDATNQ